MGEGEEDKIGGGRRLAVGVRVERGGGVRGGVGVLDQVAREGGDAGGLSFCWYGLRIGWCKRVAAMPAEIYGYDRRGS